MLKLFSFALRERSPLSVKAQLTLACLLEELAPAEPYPDSQQLKQ